MRKITYISGLFRNIRGGIIGDSGHCKNEIIKSLQYNPHYKDMLICYADCEENAALMRSLGLNVYSVLDNAPDDIISDSKFKMKHWMVYNAIKQFDDIVWIDWDTFNCRPIDKEFESYCFKGETPKFTRIKGDYWAIVNCAVYYANSSHLGLMEKSFSSVVSEPNDELLWASVLPFDIKSRDIYWFGDRVINVWDPESDLIDINDRTYFIHVKDFDMLSDTSIYKSNQLNVRLQSH